MPRSARRRFRAIEAWINSRLRALLSALFGRGVALLRAVHILPQQPADSGQGILIVHLTPHLGDTILLMPMIEALRAAQPHARLEVAVEASAAPLLREMPELDAVHAFKLGKAPSASLFSSLRRALQVARAYWAQRAELKPSLCLLPRWGDDLYRSRVLAFLTGAPRRVGFASTTSPAATHSSYRDALLTDCVHTGSGLQEVERNCLPACAADLLAATSVSGLSARTVPALERIANAVDWPSLAARLGIDQRIDQTRPFAVLAPGASMERRVWPVANWRAVGESLEAMGFQLVLLSGASDREIAEQLHEELGRRPALAAGKTTLQESAALIKRASLFLGNDSGPGHIAGALGVPTIVLFVTVPGSDPDGPSAPERIRPAGPWVECCCPAHSLDPCQGTCHAAKAHCITLIQPEDVLKNAVSALRRARQAEKTSYRQIPAPLAESAAQTKAPEPSGPDAFPRSTSLNGN